MKQRILVTGGALGIGRAVAERLLAAGYAVTVQHRKSPPPPGADGVQGDFSTIAGIDKFIEKYRLAYPETTGLVHCVGNYSTGSLATTKDATWEELFNTNFHAARKLTQALCPPVTSVVYIGMAGLTTHRCGGPAPAYMLVKEALCALTVGFARELGHQGVRVNMVSPYWTERSVTYPKDVNSAVPLGRLARLDEIAAEVQQLLESPYVTGQNMEVAGGAGL